jgi:hypothetical protein
MSFLNRAALVALGLALAAPTLASADTYTQVNFSGALAPGSGNAPKAPFAGNGFFQGDPISGHFVLDDANVPAASGFSIFTIDNYPDIANIPAADAFSITLDSITLNFGDNLTLTSPLNIQYLNGQFFGLVFDSDFTFNNTVYQLAVNSTAVHVTALDGIPNVFDPNGFPTGPDLMHGTLNRSLTGATPFIPTSPGGGGGGGGGGGVPEPASWALMILGFGAVGAMIRRRQSAALA